MSVSATLSFARDIRPMFTNMDVDHMKKAMDLSDRASVSSMRKRYMALCPVVACRHRRAVKHVGRRTCVRSSSNGKSKEDNPKVPLVHVEQGNASVLDHTHVLGMSRSRSAPARSTRKGVRARPVPAGIHCQCRRPTTSVPFAQAMKRGASSLPRGLFTIDRVFAWSCDTQQQQAAHDRYVLVEIDHVRHPLAIEHRPVVVADHGGGERI
jgi:hypothetical protein